MKLSRRTNLIILWILAGALVLGMVITFTPTMGLGGGQSTTTPAIIVNGEAISELAVVRARSNTLFNLVTEGEVGADLELLLIDDLVRQELIRQEAARQRVSSAEVRTAVDEFRVSRGVAGRANDSQYLAILANSGFSDETFRAYLSEQLRQEKWQSEVVGSVTVSDAEVEAYYLANSDLYQTEERILARALVVATRDEADALRAELTAGADAAELARERSLERADRDGALGAGAGETEPRPVGRAALPTPVATAAFALRGPGITDVVEVLGQYHVVVVESFLPATVRPFEEVESLVREDALEAKQAQALDEAVRRLQREARVEISPRSTLGLRYEDSVVARVGDVDILRSQLVRATYTNPQIQQALSPDTAFLITAFFKPALLDQLIDQELAYQGSQRLDVPFVGPRSFVAQSALEYVTRDVTVDADEIEAFYQSNLINYTVAASAAASRVDFDSVAAAEGFREAVLGGALVDEALEAHAGVLTSLGTVRPGQLQPDVDTALFATEAFDALPSGGEVSDVLVLVSQPAALPESLEVDEDDVEAETEEQIVVLIADRTPERVRPLSEVFAQVEASLLAERRAAAREAWLAELRAEITVENLTDLGDGGFGLGDFEVAPADDGDDATEDTSEDAADGDAPEGASSGDAESTED